MKRAGFLILVLAFMAAGAASISAEKGVCQAGKMKVRVACLSERLAELESKIEDSKKEEAESEVEGLKSSLGTLKAKIEEVEGAVSQIDDFESKLEVIEDLESRMGLMESKVEGIEANLPSLGEEQEPRPAEPEHLIPEERTEPRVETPMPQEAAPQTPAGAAGAQPLTKAECDEAHRQWNENALICD
jgi:TolA-binding protein